MKDELLNPVSGRFTGIEKSIFMGQLCNDTKGQMLAGTPAKDASRYCKHKLLCDGKYEKVMFSNQT